MESIATKEIDLNLLLSKTAKTSTVMNDINDNLISIKQEENLIEKVAVSFGINLEQNSCCCCEH